MKIKIRNKKFKNSIKVAMEIHLSLVKVVVLKYPYLKKKKYLPKKVYLVKNITKINMSISYQITVLRIFKNKNKKTSKTIMKTFNKIKNNRNYKRIKDNQVKDFLVKYKVKINLRYNQSKIIQEHKKPLQKAEYNLKKKKNQA
jgi:hypothetical protein